MAHRKKRKGKKSLNKFFRSFGKDYIYWLTILAWSVFVLLLIGYFYISSLKEYSNLIKNSNSQLVSINRSTKGWIEIDYNNGKKRLFVGEFYQGFSLAIVLDAASKEGKIKLVIKRGGIESIDGQKGNWKIYWDKKTSRTLSGLTIKGGDKYTIKREK